MAVVFVVQHKIQHSIHHHHHNNGKENVSHNPVMVSRMIVHGSKEEDKLGGAEDHKAVDYNTKVEMVVENAT